MMTENGWRPDPNAPIWWNDDDSETGPFHHDMEINHIQQRGPSCVPTTLAMLASTRGIQVYPDEVMPKINSQAPHTWSKFLQEYGMQLAYCNTDVRRLSHIIEELVELDDLFLVSFYSGEPPFDPPDGEGKLCTAHIVTLHRSIIIDTAKSRLSGVVSATEYSRLENPIKRVFRVVPAGHRRSI